MTKSLLPLAVVLPCLAQDAREHVRQETHGSCSPAVADVRGNVSITCQSEDVKTLQEMLDRISAILNERLTEEQNPYGDDVMTRLDEILRVQREERERHASRELTDEQRITLKARLSSFSGTKCSLAVGITDNEALRYAQQYEAVMRDAGWRPSIALVPPFSHRGLAIVVNPDRNPKAAAAFAEALKETGIYAAIAAEPGLPEDEFSVYFGSR